MICFGNLEKILIFYVNFAAKLKNVIVFSFSDVSGGSVLFYQDFGMNSYSVDINEAMKRGNKALNVSSLQFLRSVKRFIASSLRLYTQR
jgi:hypothetical protein